MKCRIFIMLLCVSTGQAYAQQAAYKNKSLSPEVRAKDLLERMTLNEKVAQTQCLWSEKSKLAFGHGLSYTTFEYSKPRLADSTIKKNGTTTLNVQVKNTGSRAGAEVVQLYIRDEYASITRPVKELKGFKKIWLQPGESQTVSFTISPELLAFYNKDMKWVVEPGDFTLMVGTASNNTQSIRLAVQ